MNELDKNLADLSQASIYKGVVREVIQFPDERLSQVSVAVVPGITASHAELQKLLKDLVATMQANRAIGLAAIQIGVPLRVLVVQDETLKPIRMVNPTIVKAAGASYAIEGCLSLRGGFAKIRRPQNVEVNYFDENLDPQSMTVGGLLARSIQHEVQHLSGETLLDSLSSLERSDFLKKLKLRNRKIESSLRKLTRQGSSK